MVPPLPGPIRQAVMLGGTTAVLGGGVWHPGNHVMVAAGVADSRESALAYIRRLVTKLRTPSIRYTALVRPSQRGDQRGSRRPCRF